MPDANDMDLVREFARDHSEAAFTELVRRHLNLVYSVARRCTGNDGDAHDVAQAVFIILARKAAGLREKTLLTGWLYETTRFAAARLLRTNARRHAREQEAYMQSTLNEADNSAVWEKLSPHLEAAMDRLNAADRALLVLRFKLPRISCTGGTLNSSQTHLPTTWACVQISGISVFNRPSNDKVASFLFTVILFLAVHLRKQVASGLVILTGSADGTSARMGEVMSMF